MTLFQIRTFYHSQHVLFFQNPNNATFPVELHEFSYNNPIISIELHGFSDVSFTAYAVCINLLYEKKNGDKKCVLGLTA